MGLQWDKLTPTGVNSVSHKEVSNGQSQVQFHPLKTERVARA